MKVKRRLKKALSADKRQRRIYKNRALKMTKKSEWDILLNLDEEELRAALSQSHHLKNITGSPAKIKELLFVLHGLAEEKKRDGVSLFSKAEMDNTARLSISVSTPSVSTKIASTQGWREKARNGDIFPQDIAQAKVLFLDFGIDTNTQFFGLYAAGRPDLLLYVPPVQPAPSKTDSLVLDLTKAGYLTNTLWSVSRFGLDHIQKDKHGDPLLLSVEDQGLFLNGQFQNFKKEFPQKTLTHFSQLYVCDKALRPFVHDGLQFLYRGDPRRQSTRLRLTCE